MNPFVKVFDRYSPAAFFRRLPQPRWLRGANGKGFRAYYLLVVSIIFLTIAIQSIIQYSLSRQRSTAMVVRLATEQRTLAQRVLNEAYACRFHDCDFAELKGSLVRLDRMDSILQYGSEQLGVRAIKDPATKEKFKRLKPHLVWLYNTFDDYNGNGEIAFSDLRYRTDRITDIMEGIVGDLQYRSERDIQGMMLIELELAIFSLLILLFEIFFIVHPIMDRTQAQKKRLAGIAWHQTQVFDSHIKQIEELNYVLRVEKNLERKEEILRFIQEDLDRLSKVSEKIRTAALKEEDLPTAPHLKILDRFQSFLEKYQILPAPEISDGGTARSEES